MLIPFGEKLNTALTKDKITVLQINLGKICNLACTHCHVEAGPQRTETLSQVICDQLIELIERFPQIKTVDLTGGAPEMNGGFKLLVEAAKKAQKEVIVRSNLTVFFESGYESLPEYLAEKQVRIIASLPCYLPKNVDKQRGLGVYNLSILAIKKLNQLGYANSPNLVLDLVYNPPIPRTENFSLTPNQLQLEKDYREYLRSNFSLEFNHLFTLINLPIGRVKNSLQQQQLYLPYLKFLENNYNPETVNNLMCRQQLSIDYQGNVYDCDFNQMEGLAAQNNQQENLTVKKLLEIGNLNVIFEVKTANYCYGCTAGSGSSCGGALVN